jgi:hypothetical protein
MMATSAINTERIFLAGFMMLPFLLSWYEPETEPAALWKTGVTINYKISQT